MKEMYYRKSQRTHASLLQSKTELMFIYPMFNNVVSVANKLYSTE